VKHSGRQAEHANCRRFDGFLRHAGFDRPSFEAAIIKKALPIKQLIEWTDPSFTV
jgi:hypothetical protein